MLRRYTTVALMVLLVVCLMGTVDVLSSDALVKCKTCDKDVSVNALTCLYCGESMPGISVKCPKCRSTCTINRPLGEDWVS